MNNSKSFDICDTLVFKAFKDIEDAVQRHKWTESEKAGRDVGYDFARVDWAVRHRKKPDQKPE